MFKLYNTYSRRKEEFKSLKNKEVRMYCCGPTVYNYAHIGNLRTYVFEDVLRRFLKYSGFTLFEAMNLTDVDDKTIKRSQEQKISLKEFTELYSKYFFEDCQKLHIEKPEVVCKATGHIKEMVENVKKLIDAGMAYKSTDGSIYFKVSAFPEYGKLSHLDLTELKPGNRVSTDEYEKEGVSDFALWKAWTKEDGEVYWETELGKGRPGWHIECSAMSAKYLGGFFDIHCGGVDLIFPHHENEIAQSQPLSGKPLAKFWVHGEHLLVDGQRMGKRFKNFYTLGELREKGFDPLVLRYFYLSSHYRQQLNFTFDALSSCQTTLQKLQLFLEDMRSKSGKGKPSEKVNEATSAFLSRFENAMNDDLDSPQALAALHGFVTAINKLKRITAGDAAEILGTLERVDSVFGFFNWQEKTIEKSLRSEVESLLVKRESLRKEKKFKEADEIRAQLAAKGIIVEDGESGQKWHVAPSA